MLLNRKQFRLILLCIFDCRQVPDFFLWFFFGDGFEVTSPKRNGQISPGHCPAEHVCCWVQSRAACPHLLVHWYICVSREPSLFLPFAGILVSQTQTNLNRVCLTVAVPSNLGGKGCPQFDSLLSSGMWIRIKLKSLPKTVCCSLQYVCMNIVAINFEHLVLWIVILTATLQQEGNAFLSFLEIRHWHMKAE